MFRHNFTDMTKNRTNFLTILKFLSVFLPSTFFFSETRASVLEYNEAKQNSEILYTKTDDIYTVFLCLDSSDINYNNYMDLLLKTESKWYTEDVNFFYMLYEDERVHKLMDNNGIDYEKGRAQLKFVKYIRQRRGSFKAFWSDVEGKSGKLDLADYLPGKIDLVSKEIVEFVESKFPVRKAKKNKKVEL